MHAVRTRLAGLCRSPWFVSLFALVLGLIMLAAFVAGGNTGTGLVALGIMAGFALILTLGGRSETLRAMRGDAKDERTAALDLRALAVTGTVLVYALIAAFFVDVARGNDGSPYSWLCAIGGVTYLATTLLLYRRR